MNENRFNLGNCRADSAQTKDVEKGRLDGRHSRQRRTLPEEIQVLLHLQEAA